MGGRKERSSGQTNQARSRQQRETESSSRDLNKKQATVLQSLQKLDNSIDRRLTYRISNYPRQRVIFQQTIGQPSSGSPSTEDHWRPIKSWMQRSRARISNGNSWNAWDAPKLRLDRLCGGTCLRNSSRLGLTFPQS